MCSIYDNLRKGLGNVSKDRCIFIFLTLLSIFAGSYCCNIVSDFMSCHQIAHIS